MLWFVQVLSGHRESKWNSLYIFHNFHELLNGFFTILITFYYFSVKIVFILIPLKLSDLALRVLMRHVACSRPQGVCSSLHRKTIFSFLNCRILLQNCKSGRVCREQENLWTMIKTPNEKQWNSKKQSWKINTNNGGYLLSATPGTKQYKLHTKEK